LATSGLLAAEQQQDGAAAPVLEQAGGLLGRGRVEAPASSPNSEPRSACSDSALRSAALRALRLTLTV
jgi:hypothetical protein